MYFTGDGNTGRPAGRDSKQRKEREIAEGGCERSEACEEDAAKSVFFLHGVPRSFFGKTKKEGGAERAPPSVQKTPRHGMT